MCPRNDQVTQTVPHLQTLPPWTHAMGKSARITLCRTEFAAKQRSQGHYLNIACHAGTSVPNIAPHHREVHAQTNFSALSWMCRHFYPQVASKAHEESIVLVRYPPLTPSRLYAMFESYPCASRPARLEIVIMRVRRPKMADRRVGESATVLFQQQQTKKLYNPTVEKAVEVVLALLAPAFAILCQRDWGRHKLIGGDRSKSLDLASTHIAARTSTVYTFINSSQIPAVKNKMEAPAQGKLFTHFLRVFRLVVGATTASAVSTRLFGKKGNCILN